jgi:hypothetical protein
MTEASEILISANGARGGYDVKINFQLPGAPAAQTEERHATNLAGVEEIIRTFRTTPRAYITEERTKAILQHVADKHALPADISAQEKAAMDDLFHEEEGVYLTTLGEMTLEEAGGSYG